MDKKALLRASALPAAAFLAGLVFGSSPAHRRAPRPAPVENDWADLFADAPVADAPAPAAAPRPLRDRTRAISVNRVALEPSKWTSGKARVVFAVDESLDRETVASNILPHVSVSRGGAPLQTKLLNVETRTWRDETAVYLGILAPDPVTNATVRFGAGLRGIDRLALGEDAEEDVSYEPPTIAIRDTESDVGEFSDRATIHFRLTEEADLDSLREHVRVSPVPDGGWTLVRDTGWYRPHYTLTGAFKPDAKYELSLRPGVVASDGLPFSLSTDAVPLRTASAPVALELLSKGHYLTPRDRVGVAFRTQNAPHATVTLARILPQNVGELARRREAKGRYWWEHYAEGDGMSGAQEDSYDLTEHPSLHARVVVAPAAAPDSVVTNVVALADFADAGTPLRGGAYLLGVSATDTNKTDAATRSLDRLVVISDVGIQARRAADRLDVFAARLSTGLPIAGATVSFFARNGAPLGAVTADAEGRATLAEPDSLRRAHLVCAAAPDGDWTFIVLREENEVEETPAGAPSGAAPYPASPFALAGALFSDRGIYRHGEPVFFEALVRTAKTGRAPEPLPLELAIARPDGVEVQVFKLVSDARGRVAPAAAWTVPEGQPSGTWSAELRVPGSAAHGARCVLARRAFSVEEFAPPQIKAQVLELPESVLCTQKDVSFRVRGDYFFGAPAADRPIRARAMLRNASFRPAGYDGKRWHFGPADERDEIFDEVSFGAGTHGGDGGEALFSFKPAETRAKTAPGPVRCVVEGTVQEPGGRQIAARAATTLHVRPWYLGLGLDPAAAGEALPVEIALVAPDGSLAADAAPELELRFCKVNRSWDYETDERGRWTWRDKKWEDLVGKTNVVAAAGAARALFRVPDVDGDYVVHAAWKGPDGLVTATDRAFSTWGRDAGARALAGPARLTLETDRKRYAPGDVARIEIRSPFPGVARVVLQRDVVLETRLVEMTNDTATVSFYVAPDMAPGFEVAASVVRPVVPESEWGPHRASGAVSVRVDDPARTLAVAVDPPAVSFEDGRATVAARVALPAGADPATARATLFLVDEAVLDLTSEKTPDPTALLFPGYRTFAELWDTWAALLRVFDGPYATTAKIGGDGLGGLLSRLSPITSRRFKPLALAAQDLAFVDGAATATFDVGSFTGEVRLTAIVWTDRAAGAASAHAKVAPALVVQPDAPRFLAPGDKTEFTATVHNTTKAMKTFGWTAGTTGCPGAWGGGTGSFNLEPGRSKTFRFPCTVAADAQPGHAAFAFTARGSGETNRVEIEIPVRPPVAAKTVTETVALAPGAVWTNAAPEGFLPGASTLRVSLEPSPAVQALPALRYLAFYPHGCCEQTASAALPLVWAQGALLSFADRGEELPADPEAKIRAAIARLGTMARGDRFAMWPDVSYCDDGASLRAAHFLVEAANAGFDVPKGLRGTAVAAARRTLSIGPDDRRARAALVLADAGAPDEAWLLRLLDRRPGLSGAARAQLALALAAAGRPDDALETLRAIPAAPARKDDWRWWNEDRGAVADAAWGVVAWLAMPSDDALAQAHALYAQLLALRPDWADGHWGWTSVNADALLATASLLRRTGGADRSAGAKRFPADVAAVTNAAAGVRFLVRAARGLPDVPPAAETNGLAVSRTFLTREGKPLDPTGADEARAIRQGDTVAVAIDLELRGTRTEISDLVVQELLPAGLEIVAVGKDAHLPWAGGDTHDWLLRADARDDRLLAFSRTVKGKARLVYLAQAVSPGDYVLPALSAEGMYDPLVRGSTAPGRLAVLPAAR
ncbi:MAG: hypothetical protein IJV65_00500 [Kiritimatiellae bacterium]|nr:hypothetical protein [Kiritimatiellia bacterium]